jgi:hypothetical protein
MNLKPQSTMGFFERFKKRQPEVDADCQHHKNSGSSSLRTPNNIKNPINSDRVCVEIPKRVQLSRQVWSTGSQIT